MEGQGLFAILSYSEQGLPSKVPSAEGLSEHRAVWSVLSKMTRDLIFCVSQAPAVAKLSSLETVSPCTSLAAGCPHMQETTVGKQEGRGTFSG